jgi:hypothetical protein
MNLRPIAVSLFMLSLALPAWSVAGGGKSGAASSSWTVVPAQDCDNGIGALRELSISRDGSFVAALRHDVCLWRAKDGHRIKQLDFAQPVVFAGNLLLLGDKILDPVKLAVVGSNKLPNYGSESPDVFAVVGPSAAAVISDRKVVIYDWDTKTVRPGLGTGQCLSNQFVLDWDGYYDDQPLTIRWASIAPPARQGSFRLSKNGSAVPFALGGDRAVFVYGTGGETGNIEVWGIPEGRRFAKLPADTFTPLGMSPDGKTMATYENIVSEDYAYQVVIWNVAPLQVTARVRIKLASTPRAFRFDESARLLVVCGDNGECSFLRRQ